VISHWIILRMKNVSDKSCRENQNTLMFNKVLFWKSCQFMRLCGWLWYSQSGDKWHCNAAQKRCSLHARMTKARIQAHTMLYNYWSSMATVVMRTCLNVTLDVHFLSCFSLHTVIALAKLSCISRLMPRLQYN